jgi:hypothetical protein
VQEGKGAGGYIVRREAVGLYVEVAMAAGVIEATVLGVKRRLLPSPPTPLPYRAERCVKIDEYIGVEPLPEIGHARMLLGAYLGDISFGPQALLEGGFTRGANPDYHHPPSINGAHRRCITLPRARDRTARMPETRGSVPAGVPVIVIAGWGRWREKIVSPARGEHVASC